MGSERRGAVALFALALTCGCVRSTPVGPQGWVVTYATRPLTTNFRQTPVVRDGQSAGSVFELQYYVRILWGDNSIGGLAEEAGFDQVYYADITTFSIWTYFKMERVRVYGHRKGTPLLPAAPGATP